MSNTHSSASASASYSYSSYSSSSFSQSSSSDPQGTAQRYTETVTSNDRDGTHIRRTAEDSGKPTISQNTHYPPGGRVAGSDTVDGANRIEDITDRDAKQGQRDQEYEERMEDEYAKREGGA